MTKTHYKNNIIDCI